MSGTPASSPADLAASRRPPARGETPLLVVSDLQRSIDFYCRVLGYVDPAAHGEPPCFAMINRDGFDLMFSLAEDPEQVRPNGKHGVWDFYLRVTDVAAEVAAITAAGAAIDRGPTETFTICARSKCSIPTVTASASRRI